MHIDIKSSSNSYPPTKPLESLANTIAPVISIMNNNEAILVNTPNNIANLLLPLGVLWVRIIQEVN